MIAQRFRSLGWVAGVAVAATGLYLISLRVAAERGKVEAVDRQIALARHDLRQLQTEIGTRASMRQLEQWNGDVLALSAPTAKQFLHNEAQLASLNADQLDGSHNAPPPSMNAGLVVVPEAAPAPTPVSVPAQPAAPAKLVTASLVTTSAPAPKAHVAAATASSEAAKPAAAKPAPAKHAATTAKAASKPAAKPADKPAIHVAAARPAPKPSRPKLERVAMIEGGTMRSLLHDASLEGRTRP